MTKCQWPLSDCNQPIHNKTKMAFCNEHLEKWDEINKERFKDFIRDYE